MGRGFALFHDAIQMSYLSFVAGFLFILSRKLTGDQQYAFQSAGVTAE